MRVSIIAPHCDDETLGCGGLLIKLKKKKIPASVIFISENKSDKLDAILKKIKKKYNLNKIYRLGYKPTFLDISNKNTLIEKIKKILINFRTSDLYLPNPDDIHTDHYHAFKASLSASKWFRNKYIKKILIYETLSESEILSLKAFTPNLYININNEITDKINVMKLYKSEIKSFPFPRSATSINSLAKFRGSSCGFKYAEAFKLIFSKE